MKNKKEIIAIIIGTIVCIVTVCISHTTTIAVHKSNLVFSTQRILPVEIPSAGIRINNVKLIDDVMEYSVTISAEAWAELRQPRDADQDLRHRASIVNAIGESGIQPYLDNNIGIRYVYTLAGTKETMKIIDIPAKEIADILEKMHSGQLHPYSLLEMTKQELAKTHFPVQIDEHIIWQSSYIIQNHIHAIMVIDEERDPATFTEETIKAFREKCIWGIQHLRSISAQKNGILKENIYFDYTLKDCRGREYAKISISPADLFEDDRE